MSGIFGGNIINKVGNLQSITTANTTATAIVAPASNTNGLIVRSVANSLASGTTTNKLFVGTAAPTATNDTTKLCIWSSEKFSTFGFENPISPIYVPAGQGLYIISNAVAATVTNYVSYDLL